MSINTTNSDDLAELVPGDAAPAFVAAALGDGICGFLSIADSTPTYARVHANSHGQFRWVFSRNGTVTSISELITLDAGQEWEANCAFGDAIGINCGD